MQKNLSSTSCFFLKSVTNIRNPKVEESEELENDLVNRRIVTLNTIYSQNRKNRRIGEWFGGKSQDSTSLWYTPKIVELENDLVINRRIVRYRKNRRVGEKLGSKSENSTPKLNILFFRFSHNCTAFILAIIWWQSVYKRKEVMFAVLFSFSQVQALYWVLGWNFDKFSVSTKPNCVATLTKFKRVST